MMAKMKVDGVVYESLVDLEIRKLYIACEKSGGLTRAELGLAAGKLVGSLADEFG